MKSRCLSWAEPNDQTHQHTKHTVMPPANQWNHTHSVHTMTWYNRPRVTVGERSHNSAELTFKFKLTQLFVRPTLSSITQCPDDLLPLTDSSVSVMKAAVDTHNIYLFTRMMDEMFWSIQYMAWKRVTMTTPEPFWKGQRCLTKHICLMWPHASEHALSSLGKTERSRAWSSWIHHICPLVS